MKKDLIFLDKTGLTSTSANHIANLAKEYIQSIEYKLSTISLYEAKVTIIGSSSYSTIREGINNSELADIPGMLDTVTKTKSLIAWLREGMKARDKMLDELKHLSLLQYCEDNGIDYPEEPEKEPVLTEDDYVSQLSVKERNRYYELQTECAVLGQAIHPAGYLSNARKDLSNKLQHPHAIDGNGRDALLYTYTPTVDLTDVENLFFNLQSKHRAAQAELNGMLHKRDEAITDDDQIKSARYVELYNDYKTELEALNAKMRAYKVDETKRIQELKIIIPNDLKDIYNLINSLGK